MHSCRIENVHAESTRVNIRKRYPERLDYSYIIHKRRKSITFKKR